MIKTTFRRGFTLIELMIVIVILGVLMGTILPRLTGAQARARDTGRIADLNTIGQSLETYFDDNGQYPGLVGTAYCLIEAADADDAGVIAAGSVNAEGTADVTNGTLLSSLGSYLKGGVMPKPAASQVTTAGGYECNGSYIYIPLQNKGIDNNGYALVTDVETYQKANILASALSGVSETTTIGTAVGATTVSALKSADSTLASSTVYVVYN